MAATSMGHGRPGMRSALSPLVSVCMFRERCGVGGFITVRLAAQPQLQPMKMLPPLVPFFECPPRAALIGNRDEGIFLQIGVCATNCQTRLWISHSPSGQEQKTAISARQLAARQLYAASEAHFSDAREHASLPSRPKATRMLRGSPRTEALGAVLPARTDSGSVFVAAVALVSMACTAWLRASGAEPVGTAGS